ncbi:iron-regulated transporter [Penicillium brasilianum]|uniref:Solute carrier family 40 member n=1 Tax=Penicillium brasilianum TaxID=104259 RepID=A0A1S9RR47_PENBI|nr:iron-regulated transporter [Penicillium brasilianum]
MAEERRGLISDPENAEDAASIISRDENHPQNQISTRITHRLYISHFLSTWNSRVFEFGAVLYLATVYPGTLLPLSAYALSRGLVAIVFSSAVGYYIDVGNRLQVVRVSIVLQRLVVAASCVIFYILTIGLPMRRVVDVFLLATLTFLACIEKLCSILNMVSVEKDWVVVVAGTDHAGLMRMNAQMRRIDLACKLLGPLFIALIDGISTETAIVVNFGMNISSVVVEYYSIAIVYEEVPELQEAKKSPPRARGEESVQQGFLLNIGGSVRQGVRQALKDSDFYFRHRVFLPSFAGALLYLTVLSFSGQMVTWLLSTGYDSTQVAVARTLAVAFEVLATWVAPWLMERIGPTRAGLWLASWQITCLTGGFAIFLRFTSQPFLSASGLVGGVILSRLGLRGFDLCAQILVQEDIEAEARGSFSSTEAAWQNLFEICSYISTMIFSRPDQFRWPALISVIAVTLAGLLYAMFVRIQRGHLLHLPSCFAHDHLLRSGQRALDRISSFSDI